MQGIAHACQPRRRGTGRDTEQGREYRERAEERTAYSVSDLLHRLDIVAGNKLVVCVEELDPGLLERALREQ